MSEQKVYRSIGLMSGTSLDGIDAALIETDGYGYVKPLRFASVSYEAAQRDVIRAAFGKTDRDKAVEALVTDLHIDVLKNLNWRADLIGFHGQTTHHDPANSLTVQLGDGARMAKAMGMRVVNDFRSDDVTAGGQGAPLLPFYHRAMVEQAGLNMPVCIINIGGVGNVTHCTPEGLLAFDTGPGNALIDDFIAQRTGAPYDEGGALATKGVVNQALVDEWLTCPYFAKRPPKSLDRDEWDVSGTEALSTEDGAATLSAFTIQSIIKATAHLPEAPRAYIVCGGGRHNAYLMQALRTHLDAPVTPAESHGWNGDAIEAEGFAYLAVRSALGAAITAPGTTGVEIEMSGGVTNKA